MNQSERRIYLVKELLKESKEYSNISIPTDSEEQKTLLRALMNVRMPKPISEEFLKVQDEYLQERAIEKGIVKVSELTPVKRGIYLWRGDITRLAVDAIVNAADSGMTGCYHPNHNCIDNSIHTFSGVQLRLACAKLMQEQGFEEPTGQAKMTQAFNLPCKCVIHTVGPIVQGKLSDEDCNLLYSCYQSCMKAAEKNHLKNIAFCCISTGVFCFPNEKAAAIAIQAVEDFRKQTGSNMEVIFNVFKEIDFTIYNKLLR